ncbi:hypothetical protein F5Y08DRAFT_344455 [Xylaria arbuscula]|nr:hypothetical protein F5Y08DRAFT_344455 [Xylaria arbuscula]
MGGRHSNSGRQSKPIDHSGASRQSAQARSQGYQHQDDGPAEEYNRRTRVKQLREHQRYAQESDAHAVVLYGQEGYQEDLSDASSYENVTSVSEATSDRRRENQRRGDVTLHKHPPYPYQTLQKRLTPGPSHPSHPFGASVASGATGPPQFGSYALKTDPNDMNRTWEEREANLRARHLHGREQRTPGYYADKPEPPQAHLRRG